MLQETNVHLSRLSLADKEQLRAQANNKQVWNTLRDYMPFPYTEKDAIDFIQHTQKENPALSYGIRYNNTLCGVIGLVPEPDAHIKTTELGYWVGEAFWKKGIATTAVQCILKYAFEALEYKKIVAGVFEGNIASMKVLEKNNFTQEKILKKAVIKNGVVLDEYRFGLAFSEYS